MGVRGLQTYMDKCCSSAWTTVSVRDLVEEYCLQTGREATIVIDGNCCLRAIYGNLDWVHGGQYIQYQSRLEEFINFFVHMDVKLVIFFDGPTLACKRDQWCRRREQSLQNVAEAYTLLRNNTPVKSVPYELFQIPPCVGALTRIFMKNHPACTVYTTVDECDSEVVSYAKTNKCFAVLAQDTDYIIYEGSYYYLSVHNFDVHTGRAVMYNRFALARHLNIELFALPLLATLIGNDLVPRDQLMDFHKRLCNSNRTPNIMRLFPTVAAYVSKFRSPESIQNSLCMISNEVFGNASFASQLRTSLLSYQPNSSNDQESVQQPENSWMATVKFAEQLLRSAQLQSPVFGILKNLTFELTASFEDRHCKVFPSVAKFYLMDRARLYGVILDEIPNREAHVLEYCASKESESIVCRPLVAERVPHGLHPGLLQLWNKSDKGPLIEMSRWKLFLWILIGQTQLPINMLRDLPARYIPVVLICHKLAWAQPRFLEKWEIDSLLVQAIILQSYNVKSLQNLRFPTTQLRCLNLATIFLKGVQLVIYAANAVGLSLADAELSPPNYFDGLLCHHVYNSGASGSTWNKLLEREAGSSNLFENMQRLVYWTSP